MSPDSLGVCVISWFPYPKRTAEGSILSVEWWQQLAPRADAEMQSSTVWGLFSLSLALDWLCCSCRTCTVSYCHLASLCFHLLLCELLYLWAPAKALTNINQFRQLAYSERIITLGPSLKQFWILCLNLDLCVSLRFNHVYGFQTNPWLILTSKKQALSFEHWLCLNHVLAPFL